LPRPFILKVRATARPHQGRRRCLSDALNKSGVYGFNSREDGAAYGVFGRCAANDGAGVGADSTFGVGVRGQSQFNNAVVGFSEGGTKSGVLGVNSFASGPAFGVSGRADSAHGVGVAGASERGYGASFRGGLAPLRIEPSAAAGSPTTGAHQVGEFFVDSAGDLLFCKVAASVPPPSGHRSRRQVGQARLKEVKGGVQLEQRAVNNHILCRARASGHPDSRL
jgi:hypothetical protein